MNRSIKNITVNNNKKPKLLDQVRHALRMRHYSYATEKSYIGWIKQFIYFHNIKHPKELDEEAISQFLTHLAIQRKVSASTQNSPREIKICDTIFILFTQKTIKIFM